MKDKFKKFKYAGIAIVVAAILGIAGGEIDSNTDATKKIAETTEVTTVKSNQILAEKSEEKSTTKEEVVTDSENVEITKDNTNNDEVLNNNNDNSKNKNSLKKVVNPKNYSGKPYVVIDDNKPSFSKKEITKKSYETYSKLDSYGRCGVAMACVGRDIMPTEERGSIGQVKPSGWHTVKYDCVDGKYLYNRCHLIGYQLTGENANEKNLITGTRYLNVDGMLPFENLVADYVKETNNHVMYRVIPIYEGNNLLASGVEMEAYSVEDNGDGVSFHVYCYNVQPGVKIDYKNGDSSLDGNAEKSNTANNKEKATKKSNSSGKDINKSNNKTNVVDDENKNTSTEYILNMNTYKFHYSSCYSVKRISNSNKGTYKGDRQDLINQGYEPCKNCNP